MGRDAVSERRLKRWQEWSAVPIIALSFLYIGAYVIPIYFYPLSSPVVTALHVVEYVIWAVFVLDYLVQLQLAESKHDFFRREWLSLLFVICPFLRPVRAVRGVLFIREASTKRNSLVATLPVIFVTLTVLLVIVAGAAVLSVERFAAGSSITTPSDALWWAISAMTGSSSGSVAPITVEGRAIASGLRIFGIGLLASMTGYVATWVIRQFNVSRDRGAAEGLGGGATEEAPAGPAVSPAS
jgi:voltage-gated potassium channel